MASVSGSSTSNEINSPADRSASLPVPTTLAKPKPRPAARELSVPITEPECDSSDQRPGSNASASSAAFTEQAVAAGTLITPMELGPSTRTPPTRAAASTRSCSATRSGPASANPSASRQATGTRAAAQASIAPSTCPVLTST